MPPLLPRHTSTAVTGALFWLIFASVPARAQVSGIKGLLVSGTSQVPISEASISIGDSALEQTTRADRDGRFTWSTLKPGLYTLRARALGYVPGEWSVQLAPGETLSVTIELAEAPVPLPGLIVEGTRPRANLEAAGFEVRRAKGVGIFLAAEDIHRRQATKLTDIMRDVPGVREVCRAGTCQIRMTRNRDCQPNYFVNGLPANNATPTDLSLMGIIGVEIYRTESETPTEFLRGMNICGAIVIWTDRGK